MRTLTVRPGRAGSGRIEGRPLPEPEAGAALVRTLAVGVCGTVAEVLRGEYGWAPPGWAPPGRWPAAFERRPDDVGAVLDSSG